LLGVSQVELENGYYFVDLPAVIESKRKHIAVDKFNAILALIATNNRGMEEEEYKRYINDLNKEIGVKTQSKFDRSKFDE
jgi:uncharacterized NAD-dependent epimerase/dehydratase family protein